MQQPDDVRENMESSCRIRVLSDLLVNKIAAGEVVERPASVVKEIVENSIDADATRIAVTIEDGGRQLIRATDDGSGMSPEELRLSVQAHATSKVSVEDDLYSIRTMGFRGEALASIAAVSRLRIISRLAGAVEGHEVCVAGDQFETSQAVGCPEGTTVEVRDLFFNVPARRKFLRTPTTEVGHINEQFARAALAYPQIGFELTVNRRVAQNLPKCASRVERIGTFYGPELAAALMPIVREERGVRLEAYAASPVQSRATAQWQYVYVNGRYVRDRFIQHAIKEAYRGLMEPNRHGVVFLFITLDPRDVDVNVHPTKIEVRWADSNLIHSQVLSALRETFQRCDLTPRLRTQQAVEPLSEAEQDRVRHELASVLKAATPIDPSRAVPPTDQYRDRKGAGQECHGSMSRASALAGIDLSDQERVWRSLYSHPGPESEIRDATEIPSYPPTQVASDDGRGWSPRPRAVQMHNLYLVAETDEGIVIVDQHALHERVMYEQLRARIAEGSLDSQRLLLPETLRVTPEQAALIEAHAGLFERLGIEITPFGRDAVAVHAFPALMKDTDVPSFLRDLLDRLAQQPAGSSTEVVIHKVLDMMACKAAVKAGDVLSDAEIDALMRKRHLIEKPGSCPHGRPTMLRLTKADLNRQFKRT